MPMIKPPPLRPAPATLAERIEQIQSEITALIEDRLAEEKAGNPGVPLESIGQMFHARWGHCACRAYKLALKP